MKVLKLTFVFIFMISCRRENNFYYNMEDHKIISCFKTGAIINLEIINDSIKEDGFPYEPEMNIRWIDSTSPSPQEINLNNIPNGYSLSVGGIKNEGMNKIKFRPVSTYTIIKQGYGGVEFEIKVWTDSLGEIYRTTHSSCGLESL